MPTPSRVPYSGLANDGPQRHSVSNPPSAGTPPEIPSEWNGVRGQITHHYDSTPPLGPSRSSSSHADKFVDELLKSTPPLSKRLSLSLEDPRPQRQSIDGIAPGSSTPWKFNLDLFRERPVNSTPSPKQSLTGSFAVGEEKEHYEKAPCPNASMPQSVYPNREATHRTETPPPPNASVKTLDDLIGSNRRRIQSSSDFDVAFEEALQLPSKDRIMYVNKSNLVYKPRDSGGILVMNFATLQRMRLQKLQSEVVKYALEMRYCDAAASGWEAPLQEYGAVESQSIRSSEIIDIKHSSGMPRFRLYERACFPRG